MPVPTDHQLSVSATRRNFQLGVLNGLFMGLGETLMDPTLVLAAFVSHLTASPFWVGLVVPLRDGAWYLPQLWVSGHLQSQPRKLAYYGQMGLLRMAGLALLCLAAFTLRDPAWLLAALFVAFGLYALASGFSGLPFLEVVSKTVPPRRRGLFFAWRLTTGGLLALGASGVVRALLGEGGPLAFPHNFGVLFVLSSVFIGVGMWVFLLVDEPPDRETQPRVSVGAQLKRALPLVRADRNFQGFLIMRTAFLLGGCASPFFAVYVQQRLGGPLEMVGVYLAVVTASGLVSNMVFGRLSARVGNRRIVVFTAALGLVMSVLVVALAGLAKPLGLSGMAAAECLLPVFALMGAREAGLGVAAQSLLLEIAPPAERSVYLGFTNSVLGVVLLSTGLSGVVVERFGFMALIWLTLAAYGVGLLAALAMKEAPPA
jgi:MFS family permease